jgi:hypothetical protein
MASLAIVVFILIFWIGRGETGVDILWNEMMLLLFSSLYTGEICVFEWSVFIERSAYEICAVRKIRGSRAHFNLA